MSLYAPVISPRSLAPPTLRKIGWGVRLLFVLFLAFAAHAFLQVQTDLGTALMTRPVATVHGRAVTWGAVLDAKTPLSAALKCRLNSGCQGWANTESAAHFPLEIAGGVALALLIASVVPFRAIPSTDNIKNPGQGMWGSRADPGMEEVLSVTTNLAPARSAAEEARNPRRFYVGHVVPWDKIQNAHDYEDVSAGMMFQDTTFENMLVLGSPGSGKTRGIFRPNLLLQAYAGHTVVVPDFKFPQANSSFYDFIGVFEALGRPVYTFTPFSPGSMRIPLLDGLTDLTHGLQLARTIIAPPEFQAEPGEHYKENERNAMAAMALAVAQGPVPSMRELQRLGNMTVAELQMWFKNQGDQNIRMAIKGIFDLNDNEIRGMLNGIRNKLSIFTNENVARATTSQPGENIDLHEFFRHGGLLYIGIQQEFMGDGDGTVLLQLVKRRLDQAMLEVAGENQGELKIPAVYMFDELPNLGKLPHLMNNLSTFRSRRIGLMLGVQNSDQGGLVYGTQYWDALSSNNLGTKIKFIWGTEGKSKEEMSKSAGERTVEERGQSLSTHPWFNSPWSQEARKGQSVKLGKVALLSQEEIQRAPKMHALLETKGLNPTLVLTPGVEQEFVEVRTMTGRYVRIKNQLYELWKPLLEHDLIGLANRRLKNNEVVLKEGEKPRATQDGNDYFREWITNLARLGAVVRQQPNEKKKKYMIRIDSLPEELASEQQLTYMTEQGWLAVSEREDELTVTREGLMTLGKVTATEMQNLVVYGPMIHWCRTHAGKVEGLTWPLTPASSSDGRNAMYTQESLAIPVDVARDLFQALPDSLERVRNGAMEMVVIPMNKAPELAQQIALKLQSTAEERSEADGQSVPTANTPTGVAYVAPQRRQNAGPAPLKQRAERGQEQSQAHGQAQGTPTQAVPPAAQVPNIQMPAPPLSPPPSLAKAPVEKDALDFLLDQPARPPGAPGPGSLANNQRLLDDLGPDDDL